jgi:hypothetical protein
LPEAATARGARAGESLVVGSAEFETVIATSSCEQHGETIVAGPAKHPAGVDLGNAILPFKGATALGSARSCEGPGLPRKLSVPAFVGIVAADSTPPAVTRNCVP